MGAPRAPSQPPWAWQTLGVGWELGQESQAVWAHPPQRHLVDGGLTPLPAWQRPGVWCGTKVVPSGERGGDGGGTRARRKVASGWLDPELRKRKLALDRGGNRPREAMSPARGHSVCEAWPEDGPHLPLSVPGRGIKVLCKPESTAHTRGALTIILPAFSSSRSALLLPTSPTQSRPGAVVRGVSGPPWQLTSVLLWLPPGHRQLQPHGRGCFISSGARLVFRWAEGLWRSAGP